MYIKGMGPSALKVCSVICLFMESLILVLEDPYVLSMSKNIEVQGG